MRSVNTKHLLVALFITLFAVSCKKDALIAPEVEPVAKGKFENGFFIVNEGWFGHGTGEVSFFNYSTGKLTDSVFK